MADPAFFSRKGPFTLQRLAELASCELSPSAPAGFEVADVAPLDKAGASDLSFLDNAKYRDMFRATKAGACIVSPDMAAHAPEGVHLLISKSPYKSYALAAQAFYPEPRPAPGVSPQALVDPSAALGAGCAVEAGAIIKAGAKIGEGCWIESGAVIGENVTLGKGCRVGVNASLSHCVIGNGVRIYTGARIGQDGFGFAIDPKGFVKVPQLGRVVIEDGVEIGANTTIDRGSGPDTVIGAGTWIDNLVQIAHNVKIGRGCILVAQVGIAGSTVVEDYVAMGGQAGVAGHLRIGKGARVAAKSGVTRNIPPGEEHMGYPSLPIRQFMRQIATLNKMIKKN